MSNARQIGKWSWSQDEEYYHGLFDTREEAIEEAMSECEPGETFYVGQATTPDPAANIDAYEVLERAIESDDDNFGGEWAEGYYPSKMPKEALDDLTARLQAVTREWMTAHSLWPEFFSVTNAEKMHVPDEEETTNG